MKVKNIMFFGFAAAILSAGAANAAATATFSPAVSAANEAGRKIVSSKAYVDSVASNIAGQLKSVAVTGSYNDLDDKPTIPDVTALTQASHTHAEGDHISLDEDDGVITIGVETSSALSGDGVATTDIPTVGAVNTGLATKQALQEGNVYKVSKNGSWVDANTAVAGSGYITRTQESDGSATIAIDSTKITSSNLTSATGDDVNDLPTVGAVQGAISGLQSASHTHGAGEHTTISVNDRTGETEVNVVTSGALSGEGVQTTDIPTVGAVNTGLATKQALQEGNVYKVSKNGSWVDANTAVAGSGYITRTQESDGSATIAIDSTKITSSNLTSATGDDLNDLPTVGAVQGAITGISQDVAAHKQVPAKPSSCTAADPCVLMETDSGYGWFHMATDQSASQTGTQQASASLTANVAESNQ